MESRRRSLTIEQSVREAKKISNSKTGSVILKDNVLEESKLGNELDQINHLQKKQATKMFREKEHLLRKQRHSLITRVNSEPNLLMRTAQLTERLPSINKRGSLTHRGENPVEPAQVTTKSIQRTVACCRSKPSAADKSMTDGSAKPNESKVCYRRTWSMGLLPALVSPRLMRRHSKANSLASRDGTKDPRFTKLMESLVPPRGDQNLSDEEQNECESCDGSPPGSPRPASPRPSSQLQKDLQYTLILWE